MSGIKQTPNQIIVTRIMSGLLIGTLVLLVFMILEPFLIPIAWAIILCCVTWPFYLKIRQALRGHSIASALIMVIGLGIAVVLPILWLISVVHEDISAIYLSLPDYVDHGLKIPSPIREIPWIGHSMQNWLDTHANDMSAVRRQIEAWIIQGGQQLLKIVGSVGNNIAKLGVALITLFFLYRDGEKILEETRLLLQSIIGKRAPVYLKKADEMTRAVVYSMLVTALGQGIMGTIGYWLAHVPAPILFGILTAFASLVPLLGTFLVWGILSFWLLISGHQMQSLALLLWGIFLINPIDNVLRPLVMSNVAQVSFLLTLFGALGGLVSFGMIGLFIGPVVLALAMTLWREWLLNHTSHTNTDSDVPTLLQKLE